MLKKLAATLCATVFSLGIGGCRGETLDKHVIADSSAEKTTPIERYINFKQSPDELKPIEGHMLVKQRIEINIPGYWLHLYNVYDDGTSQIVMNIPVGVGRGYHIERWKSKMPERTPIAKEGLITEKFNDYSPAHMKYNRGFDEEGNVILEKYKKKHKKALRMRLREDDTGNIRVGYFIHVHYDDFTIGFNSSAGCVRVEREDMLELYNLVALDVKKGRLPKEHYPIETSLFYDVVELEGDNFMLHANIYKKKIDWVEEIKSDMEKAGYDSSKFDERAFLEDLPAFLGQFMETQLEIRGRFSRDDPTKRYVPPEMKAMLHIRLSIEDYLKD